MSVYGVSKLLYSLDHDAGFRERARSNPAEAVAEFSLSSQEREALLAGDVKRLHDLGVHAFLLNHLPRHRVFGVTPQNYFPRIRGQETPTR